MPDHWIVIEFPGPGPFQTWYVALVDHQGNHIRRHPIPFPYHREAERAAARLNIRDFGAAGEPEHDHRMGVLCWCGHKTPNRAVLA